MRQKTNAWVDIAAFVAGLASIISGIVLWLMPSGGYRGGRGSFVRPAVLGLSHEVWHDLHVWTSLALAALVLVHLALHWCWIRKLPKILNKRKSTATTAPEPACEV
jgi:hypothetical protein